ncbi:MAG: DUF1722 domain-containing protein [Anaerolineae bacterium]|jgi:hypothetical protein
MQVGSAQSALLEHLMDDLKRNLSGKDKQELLVLIEDYRQGLPSLIVPLTLLNHHLNRCPVPEWEHEQAYLHPYPQRAPASPHGGAEVPDHKWQSCQPPTESIIPGADAAQSHVGPTQDQAHIAGTRRCAFRPEQKQATGALNPGSGLGAVCMDMQGTPAPRSDRGYGQLRSTTGR